MADNQILGFIRRIDFEPKQDFLEVRTYAHIFLEEEPPGELKVDVYTDNPRFEAALLTAFEPISPEKPIIEVHWEDVKKTKKVVQVILDREYAPQPSTPRRK